MNKITIIGSINLDTTVRTQQLPKPGETVHSKELFTSGGGKGANQAIAAARNDAKVNFIGAVGKDSNGEMMLDLLQQDGICLEGVAKIENARSGSAYVLVEDSGENSIIIYGGANQLIEETQVVTHRDLIESSDFLVAQFETNLNSVLTAFEIAKESDVMTVLNPAPAREDIPKELIALTDIMIPNETELETITGITINSQTDLLTAIAKVHKLGVQTVIVTLGSKGAFYSIKNGKSGAIPAFKVTAVDTTAAGDTFIGAMVTKLQRNLLNIEEAIVYGSKASSVTVQRYGAQPAIPYSHELLAEATN